MSRIVKEWIEEEVGEVSPYLYNSDYDDSSPMDTRKTAPFQKGSVVWVKNNGKAVKARVLMVFSHYLDHHDRYIPKYRVQFATATGQWSKLWSYAYPGEIERGYELMGFNVEQE